MEALRNNSTYTDIVKKMQDYDQRSTAVTQKKKMMKTKQQAYYDINQNMVTSNNECSGEMRIRDLHKYLDQMPLKRGDQQAEMHDLMIKTITPGLYGDDWLKEEARVLKENGWEPISKMGMVSTPRRFGKTIALAMFAAAYVMVMPKCEVLIYSTGKRISDSMQAKIMGNLTHLLGMTKPDGKILIKSGESLIYEPSPGDRRIIRSLPAGSII